MRSPLLPAVLVLAIAVGACAGRHVKPARTPSTTGGGTESTGAGYRSLPSTVGLASFYGQAFQGRTTASGIPFDMHDPVAAHPSYPFGTRVRVTNLSNHRSVIVTIVDRGPAQRYQREGVIIDLARSAARSLGFVQKGRERVRVDVLRWGAAAGSR